MCRVWPPGGASRQTPSVPEGLEVEWYRRSAAALVGRTVAGVPVADPLVVDPAVGPALAGRRIDGVGRVGKLLLVDTDGPTVGMHFGMTGRLVVDGMAVVERLAYGSLTDDDVWDRFVVTLTDGGSFRLHDPRRFARVGLEPDIGRLGPDVLGLTRRQLVNALAGRRTTVKAVLLDQHAIAGLGNMLTDEVLWWCRPRPSPRGGEPHRRRGRRPAPRHPATAAGHVAPRR